MGSSADRYLLVHGAMWHCCLLVLPRDPDMDCRADHELKVRADGCCCPLQPLGLHGDISSWRSEEGSVSGRWGTYSVGKDSSPGCAWLE